MSFFILIFFDKRYALKAILYDRNRPTTESGILCKLNNEYITSYEEWFLESNGIYYCIVMEYCENGDLRYRINEKKKLNKLFNSELIYNWINEIINGIYYLHFNQRIIHRDIKPNNIFLTKQVRIKIGDFGISRVFDDESESLYATTRNVGTHKYMSPQIKLNNNYSYKTDCWSIGCTLYELITLNNYHDDLELNNQLNLDNISSMNILNQLLNMMLQKDENKRSSTEQLMNQIEQQPKFIFDQVNIHYIFKLSILKEISSPGLVSSYIRVLLPYVGCGDGENLVLT
jgi:serine/threonine protein kinase